MPRPASKFGICRNCRRRGRFSRSRTAPSGRADRATVIDAAASFWRLGIEVGQLILQQDGEDALLRRQHRQAAVVGVGRTHDQIAGGAAALRCRHRAPHRSKTTSSPCHGGGALEMALRAGSGQDPAHLSALVRGKVMHEQGLQKTPIAGADIFASTWSAISRRSGRKAGRSGGGSRERCCRPLVSVLGIGRGSRSAAVSAAATRSAGGTV